MEDKRAGGEGNGPTRVRGQASSQRSHSTFMVALANWLVP